MSCIKVACLTLLLFACSAAEQRAENSSSALDIASGTPALPDSSTVPARGNAVPRDSLHDHAARLLAQGHWQEALDVYRRLPASVHAKTGIGIAQLRLWNLTDAITTLSEARRMAPADAEVAGYLAEALTLNKQLNEALLIYREVIALDSTNVEARASYALALAWSGDRVAAIREYRTALLQQPAHVRSRLGLAEALGWQKDFTGALVEYQRVLESTAKLDERSRALAGAGQIRAWQGDLAGASASYEAALQANPRNVDALFRLGELLEWRREYKRARATYEEILQIDPRHGGAKQRLLQLAWVK